MACECAIINQEQKIDKKAREIARRPVLQLNNEIIKEILLRLPARQVLKFRLVCKLFAQLSSRSSFVSAHVRRNRTDSDLISFVMHPKRSRNLCIIRDDNQSSLISNETNLVRAPCFSKLLRRGMRIEAVCDGLLCCRKVKFSRKMKGFIIGLLVIVNPLTDEWQSVSLPRVTSRNQNNLIVLGFYFHAPSSKYRLLLQFENGQSRPASTCAYAILELGPYTLRPKQNPSINGHFLFLESVPVWMNGCLHWFKFNGGTSALILVFNSETEKFTNIPISGKVYDFSMELCVIKGKLCLLSSYPSHAADIWVLEDYAKGFLMKMDVTLEEFHVDRHSTRKEQVYNVLSYSDGNFLFVEPGFNDIASADKLTIYYAPFRMVHRLIAFSVRRCHRTNGATWFCRRFFQSVANVREF